MARSVEAQSLSWVKERLAFLQIAPQKKWGQSYLINRGARQNIVRRLDPQAGERIWEIGPGLGALTDLLASTACELVLFEIDRKLVRFLGERYRDRPGVRIVSGDVLEGWQAERASWGSPDRVLGNLPFSSASAILASFAEESLRADRMLFTVQQELAERMISPPGRKEYSAFSVLCQTSFSMSIHGRLQPGSFYPKPTVSSTIIELVPKEDRISPSARRVMSNLVQGFFENRRKTLRNNLRLSTRLTGFDSGKILRLLRELQIDENARAETLSPEIFVNLAKRISEAETR
jgi:16S rRNA (adenine1518-N6/adenine1519-N6)-dimethyltransferase